MKNSPNDSFMVHHYSESSLVVEVKSNQHLDISLIELKESVHCVLNESISFGEDGVLTYQGRLCVPNVDDLTNLIHEEAHGSRYSIHMGLQRCIMTLKKSVLVGRLKNGHSGIC